MKKYFISLIVAFSLIIIGGIASFYEALDFKVVNHFTDSDFSERTMTYDLKSNTNKVVINTFFKGDASISYDNTITPGNYKILITYYSEVLYIDKYSTIENNIEYIDFDITGKEDFDTFKKFINITIDGLKNKNIYNYENALAPSIKVYINETDRNKVVLED
jgi:hypothetical protein